MNSSPKAARPRVSLRNLADEITHQLRRDIVEGEIKPGSALAEPVLAERFGASRAPVREALIALEREGLVEFNDRSRTHVRRFGDADFEEIRLMRIALEGMAARLVAAHWNKENTRAVEANLKQQEHARTLGELSQLDVEMHEYIVRLTGHKRLISAWQGIRWQFQMCLAYTHRLQEQLAYEPRQITVNSHRQLLAALASGKPELAEKTMAAHIRSSAEWLPTETTTASSRKRSTGSKVARIVALLISGLWSVNSHAESAPLPLFESQVRPILTEYCNDCHSTKKQKGDLDLERFTTLAELKKHPIVWEGVLEQLANNEMPPKDKPQLSPDQKRLLTQGVQTALNEVALASAGDPGPVVLRRLSNMEYTYTVRDLTGVDSLDPAREFPVDGAAGEGFTNAGAALVMSPSLLTKYLDAGKEIASHAVLLPDGLRFSPSDTPRDWTDEIMTEIRAFYAQFSESGGATSVKIENLKFDSLDGGRIPLEKYLAATQQERVALVNGTRRIADVARERGLNAKYLGLLWTMLQDTKPSLLLDSFRSKWREGKLTAADIAVWQQSLWRFATVGHIGKINGPKAWQEPVTLLAAEQELRSKLTASKDAAEVKLYLAATDLSEGKCKGMVIWDNARLVTKGGKDVFLRDLKGALPAAMNVQAPSVIEISIPATQIKDTELIVTAKLDASSDTEAAIQVQVLTAKPDKLSGLTASPSQSGLVKGQWSDNNLRTTHGAPILVRDGSRIRKQYETAFDDFRALFPAALCYTKIVPVDEVVTLRLFYREDDQLKRLMLDDAQSAKLDRLWSELHFVSESPLKQVDVFEQLYQFATQDAKPSAFEPMREPILQAAEAFKKQLLEVEPKQVQAVLDFASRAWRRPLTDAEQSDLRALYQKLRHQELPHTDAVRMTLTRVLVSPAFLYRGEKATPGSKAAPVNDQELATRLSYFLGSTAPDAKLRALAVSGKLHEADVLVAQTHRLMKDAKVRRLATEFGCQWLHVRDLETLDEKSERHFPTFASLRGAMQEETVRFFMDLFQEDRSVLSLLGADHSFVNGALAQHYGLDAARFSKVGTDWQRVDGLRTKGRGGILAFASTLSKQSGASRTSPILRGNWLSEVVLGDKLPRPPKGVPLLPEEAPQGLTERQLIERHSSDAKCAGCHQRIDPFGFALEGFDAIGRARSQAATGLAIDTRTSLPDGTVLDGIEGLRSYLLTTRRDDFLRQFCRKLLGYALGRSVQLSDKPLMESMLTQLKANDHRVSTAIELIVLSPQFREVRGKDFITQN